MVEKKEYSIKRTIAKGGTPVVVLIVVKALLEVVRSQGIEIDEGTVLTVAMGGYGVVIAFINWIKNRKK